jgi:hypothetical protein
MSAKQLQAFPSGKTISIEVVGVTEDTLIQLKTEEVIRAI